MMEVVSPPHVKCTGLAQTLGQLQDFNRDLQSNCWANLQILGQTFKVKFTGLTQTLGQL
jgi:hypothetical protein